MVFEMYSNLDSPLISQESPQAASPSHLPRRTDLRHSQLPAVSWLMVAES